MTERRFSVSEIERMRRAIRRIRTIRRIQYHRDELEREVEDSLRTYLLAGVPPEDLENQADIWEAEWHDIRNRIEEISK